MKRSALKYAVIFSALVSSYGCASIKQAGLSARSPADAPGSPPQALTNGDFSQLDQNGKPIGWLCFGSGCKFETSTSGNQFVLSPGDNLMMAGVKLIAPALKLKVSTDSVPKRLLDIRLETLSKAKTGTIEITSPRLVSKSDNGYELESSWLSTQEADHGVFQFYNSSDQAIVVRNVAVESQHQPLPAKTASILKVMVYEHGQFDPDASDKSAWFPLPLDYASQVPLSIDFVIEPKQLVDSVKYSVDDIGNWGATVQLKQNIPADTVLTYKWIAYVLSKRVDDSDRATLYLQPQRVSEWTTSTPTVESFDPNIIAVSKSITSGATDNLAKVTAIDDWTKQTAKNIAYGFEPELDASSALKYKQTTCTGYANLGAALGRAVGVPSMALAGYLVGNSSEPQQTHYINQFYMNNSQGWYRVEPESSPITVAEDYLIAVRLIRESDEVLWNQTQGIAKFSWPSVPIKTFDQSQEFPDDPQGAGTTFSRPEHVVDLRGNASEMNSLFRKARAQWKKDFRSFVKRGGISERRKAIRAKSQAIQTTADLQEMLRDLH